MMFFLFILARYHGAFMQRLGKSHLSGLNTYIVLPASRYLVSKERHPRKEGYISLDSLLYICLDLQYPANVPLLPLGRCPGYLCKLEEVPTTYLGRQAIKVHGHQGK